MMRYSLKAAFALLFCLLSFPSSSHAQVAYQPEFDLDVVSVRGENASPQVDIYTSIPYSNLRFLARTGGFEASYTVSVEVFRVNASGQQQGLVSSRSWDRQVAVATYTETQAGEVFDRATQSLTVDPGHYTIQVQVEDAASQRSFVRESSLTVASYARGISMSDPLLLDRYDSSRRSLTPNVGATIRTDQEHFTIYYEIYAQQAADLRVTYVATEQNRLRDRPSFVALLGLSSSNQDELGTPLVLSEQLNVRSGRNPATLRVNTERFRVGDYVLSIRLETAGGSLVAEVNKPFVVRWMGLESQIRNIDDAIAQLRYIARESDIRAMRNADTEDEQVALFREFWERRDPTPGTRRNERMEEYYLRVAYANERYGRQIDEGWNTDRGEVYIRFGEPDLVDRHPFNYGTKPYEIWYYNRHGRQFYFVDETGLGDYQLLIPIWDERTRM
ncbi:MAG: GWxTD domain-containing protein [Rubricoccaceae bacterium]|nr:GWxTD domain-containing protein [Rubricoccaceae bacterium]